MGMFISNITKREYLFLAIMTVIGFTFYLHILTRHPLIYGIDGPYYLIQVRSLLEHGFLKYSDPPLAFGVFSLFTMICMGDLTLGIRIGLALFSSLCIVPLFFWVKKVTDSAISGYTASTVCLFSAPHIRLMNDLLKNALGAFFLLSFIYYLHCLTTDDRKRNLVFTALFLLLTGATHILDFGVALLFLILYPILVFFTKTEWKTFVKNACILLLTVLVSAVGAFIIFPNLFTDFYKGLAFLQDIFLETGESQPLGFLFDPKGGSFILPVLLAGVLISFYEWRACNRKAVPAITSVTVVGILLSLPFIPREWLWRFLLMEFIPISFIIGISFSKIKEKSTLTVFLLLCLFPVVLQGVAVSKTMQPTIQDVEYHELEIIGNFLKPSSVVIVNFSYGYWVEYVTGQDIAKKPSIELWQNYAHIFLLLRKPLLPKPPQNSIKTAETPNFVLYQLPPSP